MPRSLRSTLQTGHSSKSWFCTTKFQSRGTFFRILSFNGWETYRSIRARKRVWLSFQAAPKANDRLRAGVLGSDALKTVDMSLYSCTVRYSNDVSAGS
ncbi:hypothetical protein IG631_20967 [Alternaria alternata]|nr:hypothetical protein IG631_20967 [Alternaria alternata]